MHFTSSLFKSNNPGIKITENGLQKKTPHSLMHQFTTLLIVADTEGFFTAVSTCTACLLLQTARLKEKRLAASFECKLQTMQDADTTVPAADKCKLRTMQAADKTMQAADKCKLRTITTPHLSHRVPEGSPEVHHPTKLANHDLGSHLLTQLHPTPDHLMPTVERLGSLELQM